jgi:transposase
VVGVDDWAFRRGQRYGTIVCDLEQHRPVDLLPERSSEAFRSWLLAHPGVGVISRDRGDSYIKGATEGAPEAVQVADCWHVLHNLREALMRMLDRHPRQLADAARAAAPPQQPPAWQPTTTWESDAIPKLTHAQQMREASRARRLQRYQRVMELHRQQIPHREIARQLRMHRGTVRRFVQAGCFPERAGREYASATDPFVDYLRARWQEGCHNAAQLTQELRAQGFQGS